MTESSTSTERQAQHIYSTARTLRASGVAATDAHAMLVRDGLQPQAAAAVIADVYGELDDSGIGSRPLSWNGILLALGLFVGINLVLYFSPEIFARDKLRLCEAIKADLETEGREISRLEVSLNSAETFRDNEDVALKTREKQLREDGPRAFKSYGAYSKAVDEYNVLVEQYNALPGKVKADLERYNALVVQYNERVAAFNKAIESIPRRSFVFPTLGFARGRVGRSFKK